MTPSSMTCTPTYLYADPQNSGWALNAIVPFRNAALSSAGWSDSGSVRYLSISASSSSATFSSMIAR